MWFVIAEELICWEVGLGKMEGSATIAGVGVGRGNGGASV
jgi:hypothetical protein